MSAAHCKVRVTARCGRPSAVHSSGRYTIPCVGRSGISRLWCKILRSKAAGAASPRAAAALEDATHTSKAGLRPRTAAVAKRSAGLDCASVSPMGSLATLLWNAKRRSRVLSDNRERELRLELWCTDKAFSVWVKCRFVGVIVVLRGGATLLNFWHCVLVLSAAATRPLLGLLFLILFSCRVLRVVKGAEEGGRGCLN